MRIIFLCSSLEPGRDGVGDYTRRLAAEFIRQGNECRLITLNERNQTDAETLKTEKLKGEKENQKSEIRGQRSAGNQLTAFSILAFQSFQESEGTKVECLRLPGSLGWPERVAMARQWVDDFNPDWVSLQFVPFGFHPKGLPLGLPRHLGSIIGSRPLHWMFHELWVLWVFPLSLRKRMLGQVQKLWLRAALRKLAPRVVATQLSLYQGELEQLRITAQIMPLHGNIPVWPKNDADKWLAERGAPMPTSEYIKLGFFGAILSTLDYSLLAPRLAEFKNSGKELLFLSAGKLGSDGERVWEAMAHKFKTTAKFFKLGELDEREASLYFSALDYGLTAYPPELTGKSGSVAAMREHGLTVLSCGSLTNESEAQTANGRLNDKVEPHWTVAQSAMLLLGQLESNQS